MSYKTKTKLKVVSFLACVLIVAFLFAFSSNKKKEFIAAPMCLENKNLDEELIIPTREDTINYNGIKDRFPLTKMVDFNYEQIPLVRGLIDTALLSVDNFDKYSFLDFSMRRHLVFSPLIVEGQVVDVSPEDTLTDEHFYLTRILIKVKDIVKSKYKIKAGDYVLAKVYSYGYKRSKKWGLIYRSTPEISEYKEGNTYLFCLNKYFYMAHCYMIKNHLNGMIGINDEYCPSAFCLDIVDHQISQAYANGKIDKNTILRFLNLNK